MGCCIPVAILLAISTWYNDIINPYIIWIWFDCGSVVRTAAYYFVPCREGTPCWGL
jgi:hypothetical protein